MLRYLLQFVVAQAFMPVLFCFGFLGPAFAADEPLPPWRAWLDRNRGRLFFTDVGGYKFIPRPGE